MTLARSVVKAIEDKKGEDILLMDISKLSIFADYFVIATGASARQLKAIADGISDVAAGAAKRRAALRRLDEQAESGWILIDLGEVIVHLFSPAQRKYYSLENLWHEAKVLLRVQ